MPRLTGHFCHRKIAILPSRNIVKGPVKGDESMGWAGSRTDTNPPQIVMGRAWQTSQERLRRRPLETLKIASGIQTVLKTTRFHER
jgi:hypothetical protein